MTEDMKIIKLPKPKKRAFTHREKAEVLFRLEQLWESGGREHLRLGQLLLNSIKEEELYNIEDFDLIERLEESARK